MEPKRLLPEHNLFGAYIIGQHFGNGVSPISYGINHESKDCSFLSLKMREYKAGIPQADESRQREA